MGKVKNQFSLYKLTNKIMFKTIVKLAMFSSLSFVLMTFFNHVAFAAAICRVNGREVPCEEFGGLIQGFLGFGIILFLLFFALGIWATVFWIMMIVHAAKNNIENKAMWIILMVFTGIIGSLIYYFVVKRKFSNQSPSPTIPPVNELEDYVRKAKASGMTNDQIRQALLSSGWSNDNINRVLS